MESQNVMSKKCLRNCQSTKGSTLVLKTKQDIDQSGPKTVQIRHQIDLVDMKRLHGTCTVPP